MDFDEWQAAWLARAAAQGHTLAEYDDEPGRVDLFAGGMGGHHNGPRCTRCDWAVCMHCEADIDAIPLCSATATSPQDKA